MLPLVLRLELGDGEEERIKKGRRRIRERKQREERMTREENDNDVVFGTHTKTLFIIHRKFKYNWVALYGNPKPCSRQKAKHFHV